MRVPLTPGEFWRLHRRPLLIAAAIIVGLVVIATSTVFVLRAGNRRTTIAASSKPSGRDPNVGRAPASASTTATAPSAAADEREWDAMHPVAPSVSSVFPDVPVTARHDPDAYARAFAAELFTVDYKADRTQLLEWAQYEDAPLRSTRYPKADWTKVLVDSLTDLTWDGALDTPVPADGLWLALRAERARQWVSDVKVTTDQQWEQKIAGGYQPPDPLSTVRDVSLTLTRRTSLGRRTRTAVYDVSLALQLGTSPRGGYGVAATNNYVITKAD